MCDTMIESIKTAGEEGVIIMIVKADEANIFDQRTIDFGIMNRGNIVIRASFEQLVQKLKLDKTTKKATPQRANAGKAKSAAANKTRKSTH